MPQQISNWSNDVCGVADGKNVGMCGYRQVWPDNNLSGLVGFYFQPAPGGRGEDTRPPEDGGGFNSLLANNNSFGIHTRDAGIGVDLEPPDSPGGDAL